MKKEQHGEIVLLAEKLVLVIINTLWFAWIWSKFYARSVYVPFYLRGNIAVILVFAAVYIIFGRLYGGFDLKTSRALNLFYSHVIASIMTGIAMFVLLWLLIRYVPKILPLLLAIGLWSFTALVWAKPAAVLARKANPPTPTVLIFDNPIAYEKGVKITEHVDWRFDVVGNISVDEGKKAVFDYIKKTNAEAVMLCGIHSSQRNDIIKQCIKDGVAVYIRPNIGDYIINSGSSLQMANLPVLLCQRSAPSIFYVLVKRVFDIVFSAGLLIITSPILLLTSIAIFLNDRGPILYKQERLTKDGKRFEIIKFRSMSVDAESDGVARLATQEDSRITAVGKFIRATRIDELPQLWNILKGEMSVVGPRPERPELSESYAETLPEFPLRLQVKAGLTGYAQVHGKYNTSPYDKLQMDLMYISKQGIATDIRIILETLKVIFMPESTEGIGEDMIDASEVEKKDE